MVVLVVDDDSVSRIVAEHILRSGGYEVVTAESAEEARDVIDEQAGSLDMIVCDYNMPGASGLDLLEELRDGDESPVPFVLVTGVGEEEDLDDPRAETVSAYLTKPVQSTELLDLVASLEIA